MSGISCLDYDSRSSFIEIEIQPRRLSEFVSAAFNKPLTSALICPFSFGALDSFIRSTSADVFVLDLSWYILNRARLRYQASGESLHFVQASILNIPMNPGSFDLIIVPSEAYHMFSSEVRTALVQHLLALLRQGGCLIIDCANFNGNSCDHTDFPRYYSSTTADDHLIYDWTRNTNGEMLSRWRRQKHFNSFVQIDFYYAIRAHRKRDRHFSFSTSLYYVDSTELNWLSDGIERCTIYGDYNLGRHYEYSPRTIFCLDKS